MPLRCWLQLGVSVAAMMAPLSSTGAKAAVNSATLLTSQALVASSDPGSVAFMADPNGNGVVHKQSGMICTLGAQEFLLGKLSINPADTAGDDVSCDYSMPRGAINLIAFRLNDRPFPAVADEILASLKSAHPGAKSAGSPMIAKYPGQADPVAATMTIDGDAVTSVWIGEAKGWLVEVRATYPASERRDTELFSSVAIINARISINKAEPRR